MRALPIAFLLAACSGGSDAQPAPDAGDAESSDAIEAGADTTPIAPTPNPGREVIDTQLRFDVTALTATARITLGPSSTVGGSLEIGDLAIDGVQAGGVDVPFTTADRQLVLGLKASDKPVAIDVAYRWTHHESFQGASRDGYTLDWPYHCGNLFPCHSQPADGTTFTLALTGVPAGMQAVYPAAIPTDAPAYQLAWAIDAYTELPLGATTAGTQLSTWYRTTDGDALTAATKGTAHLVAAFDWLEKTLGPYRFGPKYGSVSVAWPPTAIGGMEHHPIAHIASAAMASETTQVHEAAHGWFGDGVRLACWEDFVMSEGTASYLAARALEIVAPSVGASTWADYKLRLAALPGTNPVWPRSCGKVDILKDKLFSSAPYMRGAFFYKAVADKVGADKLDAALAAFYRARAGKAAGMADVLDTIQTVTGYDPTACAATWLAATTTPTPGPCP